MSNRAHAVGEPPGTMSPELSDAQCLAARQKGDAARRGWLAPIADEFTRYGLHFRVRGGQGPRAAAIVGLTEPGTPSGPERHVLAICPAYAGTAHSVCHGRAEYVARLVSSDGKLWIGKGGTPPC